MKRIFFATVFSVMALSLCFAQPARRQPTRNGDERAVRHFIDEFAAAFNRNDAAALDRLTASDYTFVTPSGSIQNKEQRMAPMKSGNLKYESVKYEEVEVRLYGNTAVVTARVTVKGRNKGADISGQFRSTLTLVKMKAWWQLVASQANSIAQP